MTAALLWSKAGLTLLTEGVATSRAIISITSGVARCIRS